MFLTLSAVLLIIDSFLVIKILMSGRFHLLLRLFWGISFWGWNAIPFLLSLLPQYKGDISINYEFYLSCWVINFFFLFLVYLSAFIFNKRKWRFDNLFIRPSYQYNPRFIKMITNISIVVLIIIIIVGLGNTATYTDRNDVSNHDDNLLLGTISFFRGYAVYFLLAILFFYHKSLSISYRYGIVAILSIHYLLIAFAGSRIHLFAILIMLVYLAISQKKKTLAIPIIVVGFIAITVLPAISQLRKSGESFSTSDVVQVRKKESGDIVWEVMNKTNSVHSSSTLLFFSGIGSGGSLVYTSTLYSLVPRFIYPNKPHPGSMDGTMDGLPGRMAANINSVKYSSVANVGISTSIEALWAGGYIMFFIQAIFSGFLIVLMNKALRGEKLLLLYFVLSLLSFPVCMMEVSLVNFSMSIQRFLVVYSLFYILFSTQFKKYCKRDS
jgi:hypothetical protein